MKLAVEIVKADDLKPKSRNGSANPFVLVEFQGKRRRTTTKLNYLSPCWDETLLFPVTDPLDLPQSTIEVSVFHDGSNFGSTAEHRNIFLGRVRLSGSSVAPCRLDAAHQLCPLDKRSFFSNVRGELTLRVYVVAEDDDGPANSTVPALNFVQAEAEPETVAAPSTVSAIARTSRGIQPLPPKKKRSQLAPAKEKVLREFRSIGTAKDHALPTNTPQVSSNRDLPPSSPYYYREGQEQTLPAAPYPSPPKKTEYELVETRPSLAALLGYLCFRNSDKIKNTYDLVEQMEFLYVLIVRARDLSAPGIAGSLDPYVEVKVGNFIGKTKHRVQSRNPEWGECFAVSKAHLTAALVEVIVRDKNLLMDNSVGKVAVEVVDVPVRVPPDGPVAPQWYRLWKVNGDYQDKAYRGEIMVSLWNGTQADEQYSVAVHSDAALLPSISIPHTRSHVYYSPQMSYLRVKVDSAQDLLTSRPDPEIFVKARFGPQMGHTRVSPVRSPNPTWKNEEIMFVASEPFDELLLLTVMDRASNEALAQVVLGKGAIRTHADHRKPLPSQWFALEKPGGGGGEYGKIQVACYYDNSYHVIDEAAHFTSDYQPSARPLRRATIGWLEIGILDAKDLAPQWSNRGKMDNTTNAYCVAKYGPKWVRTRTILGSTQPWWNEQFSWEVHDPSTVLTIAVFNNSRVDGKNNNGTARDEPLGKIRIRLSTLDINRVYTHYHPLLAVHPTGVEKTGELHLAVRFTYPSFWFSLLWMYMKPLYNKMHYLHPIPHHQMPLLRHHATLSVAAKLARAEPPLPREVVNYVFDDGSNRFSLRKGRANFMRIQALLADFVDFAKWFDGVRQWNRPLVTVFVHALFLLLVWVPRLLLPTLFLHLFAIGLWRFRRRPRCPAHADPNLWEWADPDMFDEELDDLPVSTRPPEVVARRYDRLRWVAGNLQEMVGHLANHAERLQALISWRDPRATAMFVVFALAMAGVLCMVPFQLVVVICGLHAMRPPKLRSKTPSAAFNFFRRLPGKADMLM